MIYNLANKIKFKDYKVLAILDDHVFKLFSILFSFSSQFALFVWSRNQRFVDVGDDTSSSNSSSDKTV